MGRSRGQRVNWTEEQDDAIRADFADGLTVRESAERLDVSHHTIFKRRGELGLYVASASEAVKSARSSRLGARRSALLRVRYMIRRGFEPPGCNPTPLPEICPEPWMAQWAGAKTLTDIGPDECRWPLEPTMVAPSYLTRFCAQPAADGSRYCAHHHAIAYPRLAA